MTTEEQSLHRKLYKRFLKALTSYSMIADDDKILIGLSGGKDSLCLLEFLAERMRVTHPHFSMEAIHIRMSNVSYQTDTTYLKEFCESRGVPLHIVTTEFEKLPTNNKPVCFLCSWHRRKQMFQFAQENGFNKIALGHHMDDIIHTALLNQFFQGSFSTMPAVMQMSKMPIVIIRPLCLEHEADIKQYAACRKYEKQLKSCPYETNSNRYSMRQMFEQIEKINPEARYSIWHALEKEGKLVQNADS
jgi:tRNA 2-thiocytidine biosynthesis protein TtcA